MNLFVSFLVTSWHGVPGPGIRPEPQLWPMLQLQQYRIFNPLCWARDRTFNAALQRCPPLMPLHRNGNSRDESFEWLFHCIWRCEHVRAHVCVCVYVCVFCFYLQLICVFEPCLCRILKFCFFLIVPCSFIDQSDGDLFTGKGKVITFSPLFFPSSVWTRILFGCISLLLFGGRSVFQAFYFFPANGIGIILCCYKSEIENTCHFEDLWLSLECASSEPHSQLVFVTLCHFTSMWGFQSMRNIPVTYEFIHFNCTTF